MGNMHVHNTNTSGKREDYVHIEWIFCFRKGNRRSTKTEKRMLPSQIQQIGKTRKLQKVLQTLCDREDDDSSEKSFVSTRFMQKVDTKSTNHNRNSVQQKRILEADLTDSSSESSSSVSYKRDKQNKSERDRKAKSVQSSSNRSTQKVLRSMVKEKNTSKRHQISSDSNDSINSSRMIAGKRTSKHNIKSEKIVKHKMNRSSDSESDETDTQSTSNRRELSKRISKARQRNKKMDDSYNQKKNKTKKHNYLTSESEDEEYERNRGKTETSRMTSYINNDERKHKLSIKSQLSNVQEDDSDNSSSKEFQKVKFQTVNRTKYSTRVLVDLDIDHTKSPCINNSANDKSGNINEQSNQNLNDIKKILEECKKICSNFQMYIDTIEHLYSRKDEEQLILKSTEKIDKLRTVLEKKQKDLITSYKSWSKNRKKSDTKRSHKVINDDKESSEEHEKCTESENKCTESENKCTESENKCTESENKCTSDDEQDRNKAVSECDSEEIFSGNETRTPQKTKTTQCEADISGMENSLNKNDDEDRMSVDESKNNDKNNMDMRDDLVTSPVLGILKEKTDTEQSIKKQLFSECNKNNNETQLTDENTNTNNKQTSLNTDICNKETEDSPSRDGHKKKTLESDGVDQSNERDIINESTDMFDISLENAEESRMEVEIETNYDKNELSSKDKYSNSCENSLQDKVPTEKEKVCDIEQEKDLSEKKDLFMNQDDEEKMAFAISEEVHDDSKASGKTNTDNESLDDAEALAKKALLATDSDTSDALSNENIAKLTEDTITNDTNRIEKKNEMEDNDSDVNSVSTIMFSTFGKEHTDTEKDTEKDIVNVKKQIKV